MMLRRPLPLHFISAAAVVRDTADEAQAAAPYRIAPYAAAYRYARGAREIRTA